MPFCPGLNAAVVPAAVLSSSVDRWIRFCRWGLCFLIKGSRRRADRCVCVWKGNNRTNGGSVNLYGDGDKICGTCFEISAVLGLNEFCNVDYEVY